MKKILLLATAACLFSGVASAKMEFAKALGMTKDCKVCHVAGMKKENNDANKAGSPTFATALEMVEKLKAGKDTFAGKKACNDCHNGARKPAAK